MGAIACFATIVAPWFVYKLSSNEDMKTFSEWKDSHLEDNTEDQNLGHSELMDKFNEYLRRGLKKSDEPKREKQKRQPLKGFDDCGKGHN